MSKHTPGPWWVEIGDETESWAEQWPRIVSENYEVVGTEGLYGDFETDCANARLIAAAPELLEALMLCREHMYAHASNTDDGAFDALVKAIAKATGEQQ